MLDTDTFLTFLYVESDDFCQATYPVAAPTPGPGPALTRSEVLTLALLATWGRWASQRDFYRYAQRRLRRAFPTLPHRSQFNRLLRRYAPALEAFALHLAARLRDPTCPYEALDGTAMPVRNAKRRGRGWFAGQANIGYSSRIGWYEGFHLLTCVSPSGVITGWGFAAAATNDRELATTFFAARQTPPADLGSVGAASGNLYMADSGFVGAAVQQQWQAAYGVRVVCPPLPHSRRQWSAAWHAWYARHRQIVETVNDKLHNWFHLEWARLHTLSGQHARVAATMALHNFCYWLNGQLDRPHLAFADLIDWE
jgi:hypothetical protein